MWSSQMQSRWLKCLPALGFMLLPMALVACTNGQIDPQHQAFATSLLQHVAEAPATVAHEGVRLVEVFGADVPGGYVGYRERVQTDGLGGFSLVPQEVLGKGAMDTFSQMSQLIAQSGFNFRYRDFCVLAPELLLQNYEITVFGVLTTVAGRSCQQLRIQRRAMAGDPPERSYVIDLDTETTLLLSMQEYSLAGELLARTVYESFSLGMPASMVPHTPANGEMNLPLGAELMASLGFEFATPSFVPPGFGLVASAKVVDNFGQNWAKLTYSDGVEKLFVLLRPALALMQPEIGGSVAAGIASSGQAGPVVDPAGFKPGSLRHLRVGSLQIIQGWINDWQVMGVGRLPLIDLHTMIESAVPAAVQPGPLSRTTSK
jgi:MucB/RseB N-terminal domain